MELQFEKNTADFLRQIKGESMSQEQTQEVKLTEGMPDVGRVLGAWGQVLVRGKEWQADSVGVNGGVMAWVLYVPEDGSQAQCVETWLPFSMSWDIPGQTYDGTVHCRCLLRSVDARPVSGRKLIVRSSVSVFAQAYVADQADYFTPGQMPEDVQLLEKTYPVMLLREAGEKAFILDEELTLPGTAPAVEKLIRYDLQPEVVDRKLLGDKVVFRGGAGLHLTYRSPEGALSSCDLQIPFSQYAELEREYGPDAQVRVDPVVTSLELDRDEQGRLRLRAGLSGQFTVCDRQMIPVVEDAYSPQRAVAVRMETVELPAILEQQSMALKAEQTAPFGGSRVADVCFWPEQPRKMRRDGTLELEMPGIFQVLYYDGEGILQSGTAHWEEKKTMDLAENTAMEVLCGVSGRPQAAASEQEMQLRGDLVLDMTAWATQPMETVTALQLGDKNEPDPQRPSLILRRAGSDGLWAVARSCGSTVAAIREANGLTEEPEPDRMLLIPVL